MQFSWTNSKTWRKIIFFDDAQNEVIGVDEVGRGALCGPVVSCAIVLKKNVLEHSFSREINDSKKLSEKKFKSVNSIQVLVHEKGRPLANSYLIDRENENIEVGSFDFGFGLVNG